MLVKHRGLLFICAMALLPLFIWLGSIDRLVVIETLPKAIAALGKAAALSGLALYLINPIFSMHSPWLESAFGSLDKIYNLHKTVGKAAFYLILLHPILLGLGRALGPLNFGNIWDWTSLLIATGFIGLIALIVLTALAIYSHIRHQKWVSIHRYFGWLIPLFMAHGFIAEGQLIQIKPLLFFYVILSLAGFSAFLYSSVFSRMLSHRHRYVVAEVNPYTDSVVEVVLKPKGVPMVYAPGQFAFVSFEQDDIDPEAHPYSFSNAPNGPYVRFTVKSLGDDTTRMRNLKKGTPAFIEGPYGRFNYKSVVNKNQVWIAGGVGITPFLSMARSFSGRSEYNIKFFYGAESLEEAVFLQEFIDVMRALPDNFQTEVVAKNLSGFISADLLQKSLDDLKQYDFMICGPPRMMATLRRQLQDAGVPASKIHYEAFSM